MHDAVRQARALNAVSQPPNAHREAPIDRLSAGSIAPLNYSPQKMRGTSVCRGYVVVPLSGS